MVAKGDLRHVARRGLLPIDAARTASACRVAKTFLRPSEVQLLLRQHADIEEAVVVGVDDRTFGRALKSIIVLSTGRVATADDLKAYASGQLARYKVPRTFVFLECLPHTATGKVLKREFI